MSFQSYFNAEMRYLQHHLADERHDISAFNPQTDRILEGVAYLTARIQQRLDHDFPEIPAQLLQRHWPYMLEAYASRTILEFSSTTQKNIPKGTVITSSPVGPEKTACKFSTLDDTVVCPIELVKLVISPQKIKFYFESKISHLKLDSLKLYLNADMSTALEIYFALQSGSAIKSDNHVWLDYFGFREQYLFIELKDKNFKFYDNNKYFEAELELKHSLPSGVEIKKDFFKLNCVAAVNQYSLYSEPLLIQSHKLNYQIIPDNNRLHSVVLQNIQAVLNNQKNNVKYQWDYFLSRLKLLDQLADNATLSCDIHVSNGHYPRHYIAENSMNNLMRPSLMLFSPEHKNYLWELISLLELNVNKIDIKKILNLFNWTDNKNYQKHIDSIESFSVKPINAIKQGMYYQGSEFSLSIQEDPFKSLAEIYFFGCFFYAFFKSHTPLNHLVELKIELMPSGRIMSW